jgi:hypothetical protein
VFTSVLCRVNKEVKENNNNNKKPNPILTFINKPGEHRQQSKGKKKTHKITSDENIVSHRVSIKF